MIAHLHGTVLKKLSDTVVVDVNGVGYELLVTERLLSIATENESLSLWTSLVVNENSMRLFGFESFDEREMFTTLTNISGIGPKIALNIISHAGLHEIRQGVLDANEKVFTAVPGIGKKNANRILIELQGSFSIEQTFTVSPLTQVSNSDRTVFDALEKLGFTQKEIAQQLEEIDSNLEVEEKIRLMIQRMGTF